MKAALLYWLAKPIAELLWALGILAVIGRIFLGFCALDAIQGMRRAKQNNERRND